MAWDAAGAPTLGVPPALARRPARLAPDGQWRWWGAADEGCAACRRVRPGGARGPRCRRPRTADPDPVAGLSDPGGLRGSTRDGDWFDREVAAGRGPVRPPGGRVDPTLVTVDAVLGASLARHDGSHLTFAAEHVAALRGSHDVMLCRSWPRCWPGRPSGAGPAPRLEAGGLAPGDWTRR